MLKENSMIKHKFSKYITGFFLLGLMLVTNGCHKLDEQLYDTITSDNFLQTKDDVVRDFTEAC